MNPKDPWQTPNRPWWTPDWPNGPWQIPKGPQLASDLFSMDPSWPLMAHDRPWRTHVEPPIITFRVLSLVKFQVPSNIWILWFKSLTRLAIASGSVTTLVGSVAKLEWAVAMLEGAVTISLGVVTAASITLLVGTVAKFKGAVAVLEGEVAAMLGAVAISWRKVTSASVSVSTLVGMFDKFKGTVALLEGAVIAMLGAGVVSLGADNTGAVFVLAAWWPKIEVTYYRHVTLIYSISQS